MNEASAAIVVHHLRKDFPRRAQGPFWRRRGPTSPFPAVRDVTFEVRPGEIFGLLGPNGAGKSTTIRVIATLLLPTGGRAYVAGYDVVRHPASVRRRLGAVLTGDRSLYWKLTGRENLRYFAALYDVAPARTAGRVESLLGEFGLAEKADELVERYSTGMKQRLAIARSLLADPPVLVLDEPTVGLDPQSALGVRSLIRRIAAEGRTVLITTHYMEEADELCDRVGIIDGGRIVALDTPENLKRSLDRTTVVRLWTTGGDGRLREGLGRVPGVLRVSLREAAEPGRPSEATVTGEGLRRRVAELVAAALAAGAEVERVAIDEPTLEDVFLHLTGRGFDR
ncbi:MAG: ABC transporter ATP-binding protein [Clostridia bacterium]|nr:ABC transporter ATP-binding protein [Clostridia bacterium]